MNLHRLSPLLATGLLLGASARAQITQDDCAGLLDSLGPGTFPYDTSLATTGAEGQDEFACEFFGTRVVEGDLWFEYVATADGDATIAICGASGTQVDSRLAVYPGSGCPVDGTAVACSDDACGNHSSVTFPVTGGAAYTVQIGSFPGAPPGTGEVTITETGAPPTNPDLTNQDECAAGEIDSLRGEGTWDWDNSAATTGTEGQAEASCYAFGSTAIGNDIWFTWAPTLAGMATITTCGPASGTVIDTRLAVWPGGACPSNGASFACSDDDCGAGFLSSVTFPATLGDCYLIQLGNFPDQTPGSGEVAISVVPNPPTPIQNLDDCAAVGDDVQVGGGMFSVDLAGATTGTQGQDEPRCDAIGGTGIENDIWFTWFALETGLVTIDTCASAGGDSKLAVYPNMGCPGPGRSLTCNDDACGSLSSVTFPAVAGQGYIVQLGNSPGGAGTLFEITITEAAGTGNLGVNYCANTPNSTGQGGAIEALGSAEVALNEFFLTSSILPCNEFGYFLSAPGMDVIQNPGGSLGNFCLGGGNLIGRFSDQAQNTGAAGTLTIRVDVTAIPISVTPNFIALMPGDTWNFQCWFRDNGASNFSDATGVTFE